MNDADFTEELYDALRPAFEKAHALGYRLETISFSKDDGAVLFNTLREGCRLVCTTDPVTQRRVCQIVCD